MTSGPDGRVEQAPPAPVLPREVEGGAIAPFGREPFATGPRVCRIGGGAIGGKAHGLVELDRRVVAQLDAGRFGDIEISVPRFVVLGTSFFDAFMKLNDLWAVATSGDSDERIAHAFVHAQIPPLFVGDLRALLDEVHTPLAVRSSSLLEDALAHPFAGVYATKMVPNRRPELDVRFRELTAAVKLILASTFFRQAQAYTRRIGQQIEHEKMAVIIQEVVGTRRGDRFYPALSAVIRSYNYYPTGHGRAEHGVADLALGLGKTIVDGGRAWTICPEFPRSPPPFKGIGEMLKATQTTFWAIHMGTPPPPDPLREDEHLRSATLGEAETDGMLRWLASTYDPGSQRLVAGMGKKGPRVVTFAPLLGTSSPIPLAEIIQTLLSVGRQVQGVPVELELAITLDPRRALPARVGLLQIRPMAVASCSVEITEAELSHPDALVVSDMGLGNGSLHDVLDIVYVPAQRLDPARAHAIAREIEAIDHRLGAADRPYVLIGPGRWGTTDAWAGIPVEWAQIAHARVIVEVPAEGQPVEASQGSHFFHNLIAFGVIYLTVSGHGEGRVDRGWLEQQPVASEAEFVRHIRLECPLSIRADGRNRLGVIARHAT